MAQLYFAFGSNLNIEQMSKRCPGARPVSAGVLPRHRIAFCGRSRGWGGGVANVFRDTGSSTPGLLYSIDRRDLKRLDGYEGHPFVYERERVTIDTPNGGQELAWTYRMKSTYQSSPANDYFSKIYEGYKMIDEVVTADHISTLHDAREYRAPIQRRARPAARPSVQVRANHCEMPFLFADRVVEAMVRSDLDDEADRFQTEVIMREVEFDLDAIINIASDYVDVEEMFDIFGEEEPCPMF
jgi:gamma-glutamylcyclotransferase (GGCT)/AIG2-like uncharacterized protein YtfP